MWVVTDRGFYSVVEHRENSQMLIVRCRAHGDMQALAKLIDGLDVFRDDFADYPWRAVVSRRQWADALGKLVASIDYDNFKDSVKKRQGPKRAGVYMRVWSALTALESRSQRRRRQAACEARWPEPPVSYHGLFDGYSGDDDLLGDGDGVAP
jgi:hypothetical protein